MTCKKLFAALMYLLPLWAGITGCAKEYSFEGGPVPSVPIDTVPVVKPDTAKPAPAIVSCSGCAIPDTASNKWSFSAGGSMLCGLLSNTVISFDGSGMTFFGPSRCSKDSGLIITAYFATGDLRKDQASITAGFAVLQYYDNTTQSDVLQTKPPQNLSFTMYNYVKQTGTANGVFSGWVMDKKNIPVRIDSGKFTIRF